MKKDCYGRTRSSRVICLLLLSVVLAVTAFTSSAHAAEGAEPQISQLVISVWPEYDDPRVLVIYAGEFALDSPAPSEGKFVVPKGAEINSACSIGPDGAHHPQPYQIVDTGEFVELIFKLPYPAFHMEYYYAGIEGQPDKVINYLVQSLYPVDDLEIDVLQPLQASNFQVSPVQLTVWTDADGFKHHRVNLGKVSKEQLIELTIAYTKTDPNPSLTILAQNAAEPTNLAMIALAGGGVILLAVVSYWVVSNRSRRRYAPATNHRRRVRDAGLTNRSPSPKSRKGNRTTSGALFCTSCGARLRENAFFCWKCGEAMREE